MRFLTRHNCHVHSLLQHSNDILYTSFIQHLAICWFFTYFFFLFLLFFVYFFLFYCCQKMCIFVCTFRNDVIIAKTSNNFWHLFAVHWMTASAFVCVCLCDYFLYDSLFFQFKCMCMWLEWVHICCITNNFLDYISQFKMLFLRKCVRMCQLNSWRW